MVKRNSERINIGAADLVFTPAHSNVPVYLGLTRGGTTLTYEPEFHDLTSDQTGTTALDSVLIGENVTIETELLDTTLEHISTVVPTAEKEGSDKNVDAVTFGRRPGLRLADHAGELKIHPISAGIGVTDTDVTVYRAANKAGLELAYELDNEWVIPCEFVAYPDDFRPEGDQLFRIGKELNYKEPNKRIVAFWITPANPEIKVGGNISFKCNAMYEDGTTEDATDLAKWTIINDEIASLTEKGNTVDVEGLREGTTVVHAEFIGYTSSTTVTVKK